MIFFLWGNDDLGVVEECVIVGWGLRVGKLATPISFSLRPPFYSKFEVSFLNERKENWGSYCLDVLMVGDAFGN